MIAPELPRAVDRVVAHPQQQFAGMAAAPAERAVQHAAEGGGQVAAGIAVGYREHVDAVEFVAFGDHPACAGDQGAAQGGGGDGGGRDAGGEGDVGHAASVQRPRHPRLLRRSITDPGRLL